MIGKLSGKVSEGGKGAVLIETEGGVGYAVFVSSTTKDLLLKEEKCSVFTHTVFRSNAIEIFGFLTKEEQSVFLLLVSVSGIGPRKALTLLEKAPASTILQTIQVGDAEGLKDAGANMKDAQKIILELRKKIEIDEKISPERNEVIVALMAFGYSKKEVVEALQRVPSCEGTVEEQIRILLRYM